MKIKVLTAGILLLAAALFASGCATPVGVQCILLEHLTGAP